MSPLWVILGRCLNQWEGIDLGHLSRRMPDLLSKGGGDCKIVQSRHMDVPYRQEDRQTSRIGCHPHGRGPADPGSSR